jgi:hypothetical protein
MQRDSSSNRIDSTAFRLSVAKRIRRVVSLPQFQQEALPLWKRAEELMPEPEQVRLPEEVGPAAVPQPGLPDPEHGLQRKQLRLFFFSWHDAYGPLQLLFALQSTRV